VARAWGVNHANLKERVLSPREASIGTPNRPALPQVASPQFLNLGRVADLSPPRAAEPMVELAAPGAARLTIRTREDRDGKKQETGPGVSPALARRGLPVRSEPFGQECPALFVPGCLASPSPEIAARQQPMPGHLELRQRHAPMSMRNFGVRYSVHGGERPSMPHSPPQTWRWPGSRQGRLGGPARRPSAPSVSRAMEWPSRKAIH
jgi:hypothetical protein